MAAFGSEAPRLPVNSGNPTPLAILLLVRMTCDGGATRSEAGRDLAALFAHKLSPADWRRAVEVQSGQLVASGLATETRGRLVATDTGDRFAAQYLGTAQTFGDWSERRDIGLVAKALGLEGEAPARLKALLRQDSLRGLIVQTAFGLPLKRNQPPAKLRAQLAMIALERAFGNKIKAGFNQRSGLPAKAGRTLAGQLARNPQDFGTDTRLIAELAADHVGASQTDTDSLREALLRSLGTRALEAATSLAVPGTQPRKLPPAANDAGPAVAKVPAARPDLAEFARNVQVAARAKAEGWPGNRKAYISLVWHAIRNSRPEWDLSEIEFKCMLAEAHRAGRVVLANADLKDKKALQELESSAILYKNTVWHFVRVEE